MKQTFTRLLAAGFLTLSLSSFAQPVPELLYYKFDGTGTTVPNMASTPPAGTTNATIMGGLTQGASGTLCNGALIGTGASSTNDYLNTGWAPNIGTGAWTIAFRTSGISTNSTLYYIFGDVGTNSFRCFTNGVAGSTNWIIRGAGLTDTYINGGALSTPTMCAFVYDPVAANLKAYLNGVLVSTVTQGAVNLTGTGPLKVMGYSSNVGAPAGGLLDEFRLYNRALTAAEISQIYNPYTTSGFLGADINACSGNPVTLTLPYPYTNAAWSTGATSGSISPTTSGLYTVTVSGTCGTGMDSVNVTIGNNSSSSITANACGSYTAPSGTVLTTSGTHMDTIANITGCDSVITINLTVNQPSTATVSAASCGPYTAPSGAVFTVSGTYNDTIANIAGCDSIITLNLNINYPASSTISTTACNSYTAPSGAVYTASGTYMDTTLTVAGCDSVITINLTVNQSSSVALSVTGTCNGSYTAPSGAVYTANGTYMDTIPNMAGCDSVMTLYVTIPTSSVASFSVISCDSVYIAPSGAVYTSSANIMDTIPNIAGCDSIMSITLTMSSPSSSFMTASACNSYTSSLGNTYTTSGTFTETTTNAAGCDSVITLNLTINTVNANVSMNGAVLTAGAAGASYQWVTCPGMQVIAGATSQSYTATANGQYAVIVTQNSCTDTSVCLSVTGIGMDEYGFASSVSLYPNPNNGSFTIDMGSVIDKAVIEVCDITGRVISSNQVSAQQMVNMNIAAVSGIYFVTIRAGESKAVLKVVKD